MTRITPTLLVQGLDADGIVIVDDVSGAEIVVPAEYLQNLITTVAYFRDAFAEQLAPPPPVEVPVAEPYEQGIEQQPPGLGRRLGKGRWQR